MDAIDTVLEEFNVCILEKGTEEYKFIKAGRILMKLSYEAIGEEGFSLEHLEELIENLEALEMKKECDADELQEAKRVLVQEIVTQIGVIDEIGRRSVRHTLQYKQEFSKKDKMKSLKNRIRS